MLPCVAATVAMTQSMHTDANLCRPRLFVYRVPEAYRDPSPDNDSLPLDSLGPPLRIRDLVDAPVWDTDQYSLGSLIYERALQYRCRTHDPAQADLFLVPAFKGALSMTQPCAETAGSQRTLLERLRLPLPNMALRDRTNEMHRHFNGSSSSGGPITTLDARGGADHIFLNPRSGMPWERFVSDGTESSHASMGCPSLPPASQCTWVVAERRWRDSRSCAAVL